jgi:general secretion pathway protein E
LCPHCKSDDGEIQGPVWSALVEDWPIEKPAKVYRPVGCLECRQTGYKGRTGLYELLTITQTFSKLIQQDSDIHALRKQAIKDDMKPLRIAGAHKIIDGVTTADEVLKVTSALF